MARRPLTKAGAVCAGVCCAAVGALALSGCGVSQTIDPVAKAAEVTEEAPGFSAHFTLEITAQGKTVNTSGTEYYDTREQSGSVRVSVEGGEPQEAVVTKSVTYTHLTASESEELGGKAWSELEQERIDNALGLEVASFSGSQSSSNPSQYLTYLRATGVHTKKAGTAEVEGVKTTRYNATIDYSHYAQTVEASKRAAARKTAAALERITGESMLPVSVWIDGQGRVRRMELSLPECLTVTGTGAVHLMFHMLIEFSSFTAQEPPEIPPSNEVVNITPQTLESLKDVKLGCS